MPAPDFVGQQVPIPARRSESALTQRSVRWFFHPVSTPGRLTAIMASVDNQPPEPAMSARTGQTAPEAISATGAPIRLCVMATVDATIQHLCRGRLEYLQARGFEVTVVCAPTARRAEIEARGVRLHPAPMSRAVAPWQDARAVWNLWRFFRKERFDLIEVSTPKAALVGSLAAWLARAPCLVHLLRGLVYERQKRLTHWMVRLSLTVPCRLAHLVIGVSPSLRAQALRDRLCGPDRIVVLGHGSSNGVDLQRFAPQPAEVGAEVRARCNIPPDALVIGFVGRMTADKGLVELVDAFGELGGRCAQLYLLVVGDYDERDRPPARVRETIATDPRIKHVGFSDEPAPFYAAMDVLALPSYREGCANVLLEASATGTAVVTTDVTGCRDAIAENVSGLMVPVQNVAALRDALERVLRDAELRQRLGHAGRDWIEQHFEQRTVWQLYERQYRDLVQR